MAEGLDTIAIGGDVSDGCGFMSSVFFRSPTSGFCLLFPGTNIDSDAKYGFAIFSVLAFGFASQVLVARIEKYKLRGSTSVESIAKRGVAYALQISIQYLSMLVVMSFNVGIFFALIVGKLLGMCWTCSLSLWSRQGTWMDVLGVYQRKYGVCEM